MGPRRRKERKQCKKKLFEDIMADNFPNLGKETNTQIQEAQRVTKQVNPKEATPNTL